ncbi:hypothetical protein ASG43_07845 [Aureimonas sp. Leaf454]|uniref:hypothetical protein n=1 Tax=Aureimonas sp. Leaf454 TaxID=1736381 RepID=UPI0006F8CB32|nr:hypothetical protein [Aureimonas sp. Leaf454]KQT48758.1 hypothetical protein ASG43_07845 [Aureimonas sp. Leaf454]
MTTIIPAAAGYFVLSWREGFRIPIVGWKNVLSDWNQCHPMFPGNDDWPEPEFNAIECPDGSVYDVDHQETFDSREEWKKFKYDTIKPTPEDRPAMAA